MKQIKNLVALLLMHVLLLASAHGQSGNKTISVSYFKTTMLVFPANIVDADRGDDRISIRVNKKTPTVLKVKANSPSFEPTNLTVYTDDNRMYMMTIQFDSVKGNEAYVFNPFTESISTQPSFSPAVPASQREIADSCMALTTRPAQYHHPRTARTKMRFALTNVWIKNEVLFFRFSLSNRSQIPYTLHFSKFYIRDNHRSRRTSIMEKEIQPRCLFFQHGNTTSREEDANTLVVAFDKFTISDNKHLAVELFEKGGDRHLSLHIRGRTLLNADQLP